MLRGCVWLVAVALVSLACVWLPAAAVAKKDEPGPCRQGDVMSVVDRPGPGPSTITGSTCTVGKDRVVVEMGYRNEIDVGGGGTSILSSYPQLEIRDGIGKHDELDLIPPAMALRAGMAGDAFTPAIGAQDVGLAWKHQFQDRDWFQDSLQALVTMPTGTNGYSAGTPTYSLGYACSFSIGERFSVTATAATSRAPIQVSQTLPPRQTISFAPTITISYAIDASTAFFVNDTAAVPVGAGAGASNAVLVALQHELSPGTVLDVETEYNLTPAAGYHQRAIGFGAAFYL